MKTKLSVGFIQFDVTSNIDKNVFYVKREIEHLKRSDMDLIVLPELWSCGFDYKILDDAASRTAEILDAISKLAVKHNMAIVGTLPEKRAAKIYNTAFMIGADGQLAGSYQKIHLFPPLHEDEHFAPGREATVFTINGVKFGIAICFDIRFPELIRKLALQKMQVLIVPAQWPKVRHKQWLTLLQARAIENQIYVVAVNRCGFHNGVDYLGHSVIINPYGETLYEAREFNESVEALIDLSLIDRFKEQFDSIALRRPNSY